MGYLTYYTLEVHAGTDAIDDILGAYFEGKDCYAIDINGESVGPASWNDHEEDMLELSLKYPTVVFMLHGEGEESDDLWNKYFKNGKKQDCYATITFDEFDESKLI